jgi:NADH-quinone oxidoreductase subunit L
MTIPLLTLAFFSVTIAWGWPIVDAQSSELGKLVHEAEHQIMLKKPALPEQHDHHHLLIEGLALAAMLVGVIAAYWRYQRHPKVAQTIPNPRGLLGHRWYFDWVYDRVFVVGTLSLARLLALRDRTDTSGVFQPITLDGLASSPAQVSRTAGQWLQAVQTGQVRVYLIVIVMMLVLGLGLLRAFS